MRFIKALTVSSVLLTGACGANSGVDRDTAGLIGGGAGLLLGGWAGSLLGGGTGELIASGLGAVIGGSLGYEAGRSLGTADHATYQNAVYGALATPKGQTTWQNDDTGTSGYVVATQAFRDTNGRDCQAFRATVAFSDDVVAGNGAACQNQSGNWTMVADAFQ